MLSAQTFYVFSWFPSSLSMGLLLEGWSCAFQVFHWNFKTFRLCSCEGNQVSPGTDPLADLMLNLQSYFPAWAQYWYLSDATAQAKPPASLMFCLTAFCLPALHKGLPALGLNLGLWQVKSSLLDCDYVQFSGPWGSSVLNNPSPLTAFLGTEC